jgi:D-alanyl-D-alanine carboxypeptidase (penicillin-binding protein 5/6)
VRKSKPRRYADRRRRNSRLRRRGVYSSVGRRRNALLRRAVIAVFLLALALAWIRVSDVRPGPGDRAERISNNGKPLHLAWPSEGQAAVAVTGIGTLGVHGGGQPVPIASVAKVMTAYLVLRADPLEPGEEGFEIEISSADVEDLQRRLALDQSVVAVEAGEVLSERQALEALLLPSANNVAALLAVHEAGSVEAFAAEMNEAAAELGMRKTHYTDPSGWEDTTVSTAADQLKIGRAALADPTFAEIVAMPSTVLPVAGEVTNFNGLVGHEGFVGIKTGSDEAAGGCLLFAKRIDAGGRTLTVVGAVLGQREDDLIGAALAAARSLGASVERLPW